MHLRVNETYEDGDMRSVNVRDDGDLVVRLTNGGYRDAKLVEGGSRCSCCSASTATTR